MNLWSTLSWWRISGTLCLFPFVFICKNDGCVSLRFAHSLSVSPSLFLSVCSDLWPLIIFGAACYQHKMSDVVWARPSSRASRVCVGGNKLSIKCFCWGPEKIWYGGETKVICTRKFNCLSLRQVWALVWLLHQINFTRKQFRWGLTSSCSQSPFALCDRLHRFDASVYLCLYKRACMTQARVLPESATMQGSYLLFLTNLMCYYGRYK